MVLAHVTRFCKSIFDFLFCRAVVIYRPIHNFFANIIRKFLQRHDRTVSNINQRIFRLTPTTTARVVNGCLLISTREGETTTNTVICLPYAPLASTSNNRPANEATEGEGRRVQASVTSSDDTSHIRQAVSYMHGQEGRLRVQQGRANDHGVHVNEMNGPKDQT